MINVIKKEIDVEESLRKRLGIIEDLQDTYEFSKNNNYENEKDDFEMEI